ncbi:hypothetical protein HNO88_000808 [Novosphingobium chloroacetimidivorans]|uniref:Uncharacterized protein n=1 Tax=Novosphingobium chloroacetimidivorans TaxID=1428314 RepID=A0A7W7K7A7_9SPHN|nr:hypothetical protein [Novosphingobium chloroacetimidivorans]MBB4857501.1 hypothetical protein [Novosphingobium chloroacetimidivorans]
MAKSEPKAVDALAWPIVAADAWFLGAEASWVIWLRCARLAQGGAPANREAMRMVEEKWHAQVDLAAALATGRFGTEPSQVAGRTIDHYRSRVSANRSRLTRK